MMASRTIFAVLLMVAFVHGQTEGPLTITADPDRLLESLSETLSVRCTLNDVSDLGNIIEIALYKEGEKIDSLSSFHSDAPIFVGGLNQPESNEGILTNQGESYLAIVWSDVTAEHAGNYECKASVFGEAQAEVVNFFQNTTVEFSTPSFTDMLSRLMQEVETLKAAQAEMASDNEMLQKDLDALTQRLDQELQDQRKKTENALFYSSDYLNGTSLRVHMGTYLFENIAEANEMCDVIDGRLADFRTFEEKEEANQFLLSFEEVPYGLIVGVKRSEVNHTEWVSMYTGEPALHAFEDWVPNDKGDCVAVYPHENGMDYFAAECDGSEFQNYLYLCETRY